MSSVCIIPARGGSKRIPRKNIKEFCGKPIIAYSIDAALESELFDEVMVSTDDEEIAEVARRYGAKIPFMRSTKNSGDYATATDVLNEVLERYTNRGLEPEWLCCLYATAPFVTSEKLRAAYELFEPLGDDCLCAVAEFGFPPLRAFCREGASSPTASRSTLNRGARILNHCIKMPASFTITGKAPSQAQASIPLRLSVTRSRRSRFRISTPWRIGKSQSSSIVTCSIMYSRVESGGNV